MEESGPGRQYQAVVLTPDLIEVRRSRAGKWRGTRGSRMQSAAQRAAILARAPARCSRLGHSRETAGRSSACFLQGRRPPAFLFRAGFSVCSCTILKERLGGQRCRGGRMTFFVEGLSERHEPDTKVRRVGEYDTLDDAVSSSKRLIDVFLRGEFRPGGAAATGNTRETA